MYNPPVVILDNIRSALNVGSILRTLDAIGGREIYLCGITAPINNKKVKKTALGAEKSIVAHEYKNFLTTDSMNPRDTLTAITDLKERGYLIIGVEQDERSSSYLSTLPDLVSEEQSLAFVFGHETDGIQFEVLEECDFVVELPMLGQKESLNVSVAAGIILYHILYLETNQREILHSR